MPIETPRIAAILLSGSCGLFPTPLALGQVAPPAEDAAPEGLSDGDWAGVRVAYEAGRHAAYAVEGGYRARNPEQGWRTRFDGRGFQVEPDTGGWTWGLELERYGFAGAEQRVTRPARVSAEGRRVAYAWDTTLEEWYVNDARGLEHGYTVHVRPQRNGQELESPLTFTLAIRGGLRAEMVADGRGVRFLTGRGTVALHYTGLSVFDSDGRELRAKLEAPDDAGDELLLSIDERGARYPLVIDPIAQQAYLKASNTDADDRFGYSVAVSGDTVVVGAPREDSNATGVNGDQSDNSAYIAGAAYVFVSDGASWSQQAYLKASNTDWGDFFGSSVAIQGDTIVVGAVGEYSNARGVNGDQGNNSGYHCGAVYVFVRDGSTWTQEAYLKASNTAVNDEFGSSLAISNDTVVVGAWREDSASTGVNGDQLDNSAFDAGAAYVFVRNGTSWSQSAYLKASNTGAEDWFGWSAAISDDTVVIGAYQEDSNATGVNGNQGDNSALDAGAAYVFVRSGTTWHQEAYLKASNTDADDKFGFSAAAWRESVVIGALEEESNATGVNGNQADNSKSSAGAAYVFVRNATSWSQEAYLKASNTGSADRFGSSMSVSGDTLVVGAYGEGSDTTGVNGNQANDAMPDAGAAYVFARTGTSWSQVAYLKASNTGSGDRFGAAVGVSSGTVVVGAYDEDSGATGVNGSQIYDDALEAGAAYAFHLFGTTYCAAGPNSTGAPAAICASGSASVAANDLLLRAEPVPDQFGVFFYGPRQASVPFGNGTLCIAGEIGRLDVVSAAGNVMAYLLDNTNPPSAATQITPGSTWNFQAWFRDPAAGGAFFDLSDGLSVTFGP